MFVYTFVLNDGITQHPTGRTIQSTCHCLALARSSRYSCCNVHHLPRFPSIITQPRDEHTLSAKKLKKTEKTTEHVS